MYEVNFPVKNYNGTMSSGASYDRFIVVVLIKNDNKTSNANKWNPFIHDQELTFPEIAVGIAISTCVSPINLCPLSD